MRGAYAQEATHMSRKSSGVRENNYFDSSSPIQALIQLESTPGEHHRDRRRVVEAIVEEIRVRKEGKGENGGERAGVSRLAPSSFSPSPFLYPTSSERPVFDSYGLMER